LHKNRSIYLLMTEEKKIETDVETKEVDSAKKELKRFN
jgi:hypothetical protein